LTHRAYPDPARPPQSSVGIHFQPTELPLLEMYRRGVRFVIGRANARDDMPAILALATQGRLRAHEVIPQSVALDDAPAFLEGAPPHKTVFTMKT
jgi:hypothetical protein